MPQEVEVWYIIPSLRRELAKSMHKNGVIQKQIAKTRVAEGAFGENIITQGIELTKLPIGQKIKIGEAELEITKIGKECVERCLIYHQTGDCIMPREGVFAKVLKGGKIKAGDSITTG